MKKWEEQNKLKTHQKKVQGAKSTVSKNSNRLLGDARSPEMKKSSGKHSNPLASPHQSNMSASSRSSQAGISDYFDFEKSDLGQIPLYKLLKYYQLQQYAKGLISMGFGYDLSKLARLSNQELDSLISELKILPGHRVKFHTLVKQVQQVLKLICNSHSSALTKKISAEVEKEAAAIMRENNYGSVPKTAKPVSNQAKTNLQALIYLTKPKSQGNAPSQGAANFSTKKPKATISTANSKKPNKPPSRPQSESSRTKRPEAENIRRSQNVKIRYSESVDDEFAKVLEKIISKYEREVTENDQIAKNPSAGLSKKELKEHEELLKRINYSEAEELKKQLANVINGINTSISDHESNNLSFNDVVPQQKFEPLKLAPSYNPQNKSTKTSETASKNLKEPTITQEIKIKATELTATLEKSKANVSFQAKAENEANKLAETFVRSEKSTNLQARRIDRLTSMDDNIGPKSNILNLVEKNLKNKELTADNLNQELHKIKDLYASFDGAKMTSTLVNLDIEEMCFCLSCAVSKHMEYFLKNVCTTDYLEFVKKKIFHSKQTTSQDSTGQPLSTKGDSSPGSKNSYQQVGMDADKRQIMSEVNQAQLVDQVSKQDEATLQAQKKKKKMLFDDNDHQAPQMTQKHEEVSKIQEREESYSKDVSQNYHTNPMDYIDNDDLDQPQHGAISNRYDEQDEENEEEEEAKSEDDEPEEDFEREISSDEPTNMGQQGLDMVSENSKEHSAANSLIKPNDQANEKEEADNDAAANEKIENFLRESLMYSMVSSLQGSHLRALPHKESRLTVDSQKLLALANQDEDIEEDENEELPSYNDRPEDSHDQSLEFSFVSQYTAVDDLDSSQTAQNNIARIIFERTFNDKRWTEQDYFKRINGNVDPQIISDFCKSIIITSKMEKEVVIVALIYIERLITSKNLYINPANWRNTVFTALIIASKIWDDEFYENHNFAKAFPQFQIKEINELERVFLEFIDYNIVVGSSEYAKYYFILRTFAEKNKKSFPLRALDVNTVLTLQKNSNNAAHALKALYADSLNKTL